MQRVGIYPGTFDPVHAGHIAFAMEALKGCGLNEVVFLPERRPRRKHDVSDIAHRVSEIENALPSTKLRTVELATDTFTVAETLPELLRIFSGLEMTLLVGSDVARTLPGWDGLPTLLQHMSLAIGLRGNDTNKELTDIILSIEKEHRITILYTVIRTPHAHLASTQFRSARVN